MTLEDAEKFLRRCYVPETTFILLLGLGKDEAKKLAGSYFNDWKMSTKPRFDYDGSDNFPTLTSIRSALDIELDIHQHHLAIAYPTEPYMSDDAEALKLLSRILKFRLEERLREENIEFDEGVYHPSVEWESTGVSGMLCINLATVGNMDYVRRMEDIVREEAEKLRENRVSAGEFELRDRLRDEDNDAFWNTPSLLAEMVVDATCNGDRELTALNDFRNRWNSLNYIKLQKAANKYLTDYYARVLIRPKEGHHCPRC
ncbi:MAG: insulinase family protein [bacterium]|nr:insulinase family protein [bacterium]